MANPEGVVEAFAKLADVICALGAAIQDLNIRVKLLERAQGREIVQEHPNGLIDSRVRERGAAVNGESNPQEVRT